MNIWWNGELWGLERETLYGLEEGFVEPQISHFAIFTPCEELVPKRHFWKMWNLRMVNFDNFGLCSNFTSFPFFTVKNWYVFMSSAKDWFDFSQMWRIGTQFSQMWRIGTSSSQLKSVTWIIELCLGVMSVAFWKFYYLFEIYCLYRERLLADLAACHLK